MTDEELAKGWVTDNTGFNPKEPLGKIAVRTFLAGLKAGKDMGEADLATIAYMQGAERYKTKWHDLRKDPNDLPKDNDEKLCFYEKGKVIARYDSRYNCWETKFNNLVTTFSSSILIAWKEIVLQ